MLNKIKLLFLILSTIFSSKVLANDPFDQHHNAMIRAINECDDWKVKTLLSSPYIDIKAKRNIDYAFSAADRFVNGEKPECTKIFKLLIDSGMSPNPDFSNATYSKFFHLANNFQIEGNQPALRKSSFEVFKKLVENGYFFVPIEKKSQWIFNLFKHYKSMTSLGSDPKFMIDLIKKNNELDFLKSLQDSDFFGQWAILLPTLINNTNTSEHDQIIENISYSLNERDSKGVLLIDYVIVNPCDITFCVTPCNPVISCDNKKPNFYIPVDVISKILLNKNFDKSAITKRNSFGYSPAELNWMFRYKRAPNLKYCFFSESFQDFYPRSKELSNIFSKLVDKEFLQFPAKAKADGYQFTNAHTGLVFYKLNECGSLNSGFTFE